MKIVIKKLFGKFNTELELDKKLNILVGGKWCLENQIFLEYVI